MRDPKWIKVGDGWPPPDTWVITYGEYGQAYCRFSNEETQIWRGIDGKEHKGYISHWLFAGSPDIVDAPWWLAPGFETNDTKYE